MVYFDLRLAHWISWWLGCTLVRQHGIHDHVLHAQLCHGSDRYAYSQAPLSCFETFMPRSKHGEQYLRDFCWLANTSGLLHPQGQTLSVWSTPSKTGTYYFYSILFSLVQSFQLLYIYKWNELKGQHKDMVTLQAFSKYKVRRASSYAHVCCSDLKRLHLL